MDTGTWADIMQIPPAVLADEALEGGPFVTVAGGGDSVGREPRVRNPEE